MTDFSQLIQLGQQMQGRISQVQTELESKSVSGSAGGGMVTVTADGRGHVRTVKIDPSVAGGGDVEMLEDLVAAAVSDAQRKAEDLYKDEMKKVAGGLQMPFQMPPL